MSRVLEIVVLAVLLAALVRADDVSGPSVNEQARQFQRNRDLIQSLVQGGLHLAGEGDPIKRANYCTDIAEQLAQEIQQAADKKEGARVEELGSHLNALLEGGVAANLDAIHRSVPIGSAEEKQAQVVRNRVIVIVGRLEDRLRNAKDAEGQDEFQRTLKSVHDGRTKMERNTRTQDEKGPDSTAP